MTKYIVVTGGVLSGLGKGVVSASIGRLISNDYKVVPVKCDGYLNVDPGTMNPIEHGEVFVLDDGGEVDLDFGHYERFLNIDCKFSWNLTSGKIFQALVEKERRGDFLGKTVQIIPHATDEIQQRLKDIAKNEKADILLVEIGGTVGDIENLWFLEAVRRLAVDVGRDNIMFVHLGLIPVIDEQGQQKTKPLQQSTYFLRERGIFPDVYVGRSKELLTDKTKKKIHWLCGVEQEGGIISDPDLKYVYELPLIFQSEGLREFIEKRLKLKQGRDLVRWKELVDNIKNPLKEINIAICGKYTELADSYISIQESLVHAGAHLKTKVNIRWIETTEIEKGKAASELLKGFDGLIIPGGFGSRGIEGKIQALKHARENNLPFLGLCLGLQLATVEFARNVCGLEGANSTEIDPDTRYPVIDILPEQRSVTKKGGTMRLGSCEAVLKPGTVVHKLYGADVAHERHRHRYEVNPEYHKILTENGLIISGASKDGRLAEFIELPEHKYFVATQSHPELKSRLERPAPLFYGLVKACTG